MTPAEKFEQRLDALERRVEAIERWIEAQTAERDTGSGDPDGLDS
jgi:hypothetical protein